nr:MAG TPA: hypothetical protein [Caudoviricetes sp.]
MLSRSKIAKVFYKISEPYNGAFSRVSFFCFYRMRVSKRLGVLFACEPFARKTTTDTKD